MVIVCFAFCVIAKLFHRTIFLYFFLQFYHEFVKRQIILLSHQQCLSVTLDFSCVYIGPFPPPFFQESRSLQTPFPQGRPGEAAPLGAGLLSATASIQLCLFQNRAA